MLQPQYKVAYAILVEKAVNGVAPMSTRELMEKMNFDNVRRAQRTLKVLTGYGYIAQTYDHYPNERGEYQWQKVRILRFLADGSLNIRFDQVMKVDL